MRGWFGVNSLKRLATASDKGHQLKTEKEYFKAHTRAQAKRRAVAAQVDAAAARYGPVLGWHSVLGPTTEPECRNAHGRNFSALKRPGLGWPGTVHPNCKCTVVAPYDRPKGRDLS